MTRTLTASELVEKLTTLGLALDVVVHVRSVISDDFATPIFDAVPAHAPDGRLWIELIVGWDSYETLRRHREKGEN